MPLILDFAGSDQKNVFARNIRKEKRRTQLLIQLYIDQVGKVPANCNREANQEAANSSKDVVKELTLQVTPSILHHIKFSIVFYFLFAFGMSIGCL